MTIHLIRHGKAGDRHESDPNDIRRHLSAPGRRQAERIARMLSPEPIVRILSSSADRCIETVTPLAEAASIEIEVHPHLFEGVELDRSWPLLEAVIASIEEHDHAVLCSHGDIIPDLVRRAQGRGAEITGPSGWSKGSVWTLETSGVKIVRATYAAVASD